MRMQYALAAFMLLVLLLTGCTSQNATQTQTSEKSVAVNITIFDGEGEQTLLREIEPGGSALEALMQVAEVDYKQYPFGAYVFGINGLRENTRNSGKYWQYYVNGKIAMVAMDRFKIRSDTDLEFRYEKQNPQIR
ncbi:MAG: DUF4430 domain-containing protein [Candidatus Micrarchaeota archaeon]